MTDRILRIRLTEADNLMSSGIETEETEES